MTNIVCGRNINLTNAKSEDSQMCFGNNKILHICFVFFNKGYKNVNDIIINVKLNCFKLNDNNEHESLKIEGQDIIVINGDMNKGDNDKGRVDFKKDLIEIPNPVIISKIEVIMKCEYFNEFDFIVNFDLKRKNGNET